MENNYSLIKASFFVTVLAILVICFAPPYYVMIGGDWQPKEGSRQVYINAWLIFFMLWVVFSIIQFLFRAIKKESQVNFTENFSVGVGFASIIVVLLFLPNIPRYLTEWF